MKYLNLVRCFLFFCVCTQITLSEMPESPNLEELCEQSKIVVNAQCSYFTDQTQRLNGKIYRPYIFNVTKCYKGSKELNRITVLVPVDEDFSNLLHGDFILPKYESGTDYFLFLRGHQHNTYIRIPIDDIWSERPYTAREESLIEEELKEQDSPDRWLRPEDNLTYGIPHEAHEREVLLSEYQTDRYLKIIQYLVNNEIVGERGWYKNGVMAYEYPYKNGLRHGIARTWRDDGSLYNFYCYRKDRNHGYLLTWNNLSNLEITFWVRGNNVSKDGYIKESKKNRTLPQVAFK